MKEDLDTEPELRPEFIEEMKKIQKQKSLKITGWNKHFNLPESN